MGSPHPHSNCLLEDQLPCGYGDEGHRVVAENIDNFHRNDVATGFGVGVAGGREFQVAASAGAKALPFILEDIGTRPSFLEVTSGKIQFPLRGFQTG